MKPRPPADPPYSWYVFNMIRKWLNRAAFSEARRYVPGPVRSGLKTLCARAGLVDERAMQLGLQTVYDDDTFIASYPKSGNTWVRFLIANMHHPDRTITFRNLEEYVPMIKRSPKRIARMEPPRFMKTHMPHFDQFPRCIYIYRDARDVAISFYHFATQHGWYEGSLSDFVRDRWPWQDIWLTWDEHVGRALDHAQRCPERFLILQYEEMLEQPLAEARRLAQFCELELSEHELRTAVQDSSFDNLQAIEEAHGHETEDDDVTFFRAGQRRQWKDELSTADREVLRERFGETLERLGYRTG